MVCILCIVGGGIAPGWAWSVEVQVQTEFSLGCTYKAESLFSGLGCRVLETVGLEGGYGTFRNFFSPGNGMQGLLMYFLMYTSVISDVGA